MRRNCNLELRLVPPSAALQPADFEDDQPRLRPMLDLRRGSPKERDEQQQQQLTIFYNGNISVCDVTELQARAIILLASKEMEERVKSPMGSEPSSPLIQSPLCSPNSGLSMKRSLQRFLQKRQNRIQSTSPYHH
ncbi:unnamed protein product [Thlaspi arvense]|uniref:Protein TIFY n=1 Tax=Thlaspi arvense TaxID=13288 RepID=A0AAU9SD27_THLAR|nr:unnamed protein product [Thlaspi arvense]